MLWFPEIGASVCCLIRFAAGCAAHFRGRGQGAPMAQLRKGVGDVRTAVQRHGLARRHPGSRLDSDQDSDGKEEIPEL